VAHGLPPGCSNSPVGVPIGLITATRTRNPASTGFPFRGLASGRSRPKAQEVSLPEKRIVRHTIGADRLREGRLSQSGGTWALAVALNRGDFDWRSSPLSLVTKVIVSAALSVSAQFLTSIR
jgi:hypothetical protein